MLDYFLLSMSRRRVLTQFGTAASSGFVISVVGETTPAQAQLSKNGTRVPWILLFDVNESMLYINHLQPLFKRLFGDGKYVNEWYADLVLYSESLTLAGGQYTPFFTLSEAVLKLMGSDHGVSIQNADTAKLAMI